MRCKTKNHNRKFKNKKYSRRKMIGGDNTNSISLETAKQIIDEKEKILKDPVKLKQLADEIKERKERKEKTEELESESFTNKIYNLVIDSIENYIKLYAAQAQMAQQMATAGPMAAQMAMASNPMAAASQMANNPMANNPMAAAAQKGGLSKMSNIPIQVQMPVPILKAKEASMVGGRIQTSIREFLG